MKRIECLTDFGTERGKFYKGEIRVVTPEEAGLFCGCGWAKDLGGELVTGTPDLSPKKLDVASVSHGNKTEGVK